MPRRAAVAAALLAVVVGLGVAVAAARGTPAALPAAPAPRVSAPAEPPDTMLPPDLDAAAGDSPLVPTAGSGRRHAADAPLRIVIPAIGVSSGLVRLGIARDGSMEVPSDAARAGWLTTSSVPGRPGPAVIAGHVDGVDGPAVFYRLRELVPGDRVEVTGADGAVATFTVRRVAQAAKDAFPADEVYGPQPGPVLRLITCGGTVDPRTGHYRDNTVVFAS